MQLAGIISNFLWPGLNRGQKIYDDQDTVLFEAIFLSQFSSIHKAQVGFYA